MFARRGERTPPWGVPALEPLPPVRVFRPSALVSSTGAFSHILTSCGIFRSLIRRATDLMSSGDGVEVLGEVGVYDVALTTADRRAYFLDRVQCPSLGSVPVRVRLVGLEDRFHHESRGLLDNPVPDGRDTEWPLACVGFGDHHWPHCLGSVLLLA